MNKIKVTELFKSIQGEGRYAGYPSVFLRTFGCNFTCPSFGLHHGEVTKEPDEVVAMVAANPEKYKTLHDLPIITTGCDSYAAWHPGLKDFSPMWTVRELADKIIALDDFGFSPTKHLIMTGGEPLLGWQKAYVKLFDILVDEHNLTHVTFETNGTQKLSSELAVYLKSWMKVHFSVSPKLSASGEKRSDALKPEIVAQYGMVADHLDLKFVVDKEEDMEEVDFFVSEYRKVLKIDTVYLMPEGGYNEGYQKNTKRVADLAMKYGHCYSPRLQNDLYKNEWAT